MASGYAEWLQRGRVHQWEGRPVDAMLCFQRAAALDGNAVDARYLLGEVQWQLGAIPAALAAWREAARVAPRHLASQLALCEAALAVGDVTAAADASATALAIAPDDAVARMLHAVVALADRGEADGLTEVAKCIEEDPDRLASPITGGTLAAALRRNADARGATDLFVALAKHVERIAFALLAPLARAALSTDAPAALVDMRDSIARAALERPLAENEVDALREVAVAFTRAAEPSTAHALSSRYAEACVASAPASAPLGWPLRTAGAPLRVAVILPSGDPSNALRLLEAGANASARMEWTLLADPGVELALRGPLERAVVRPIPGTPDAAMAAAIGNADFDLLIDLAGIGRALGPLLARHPARRVVGIEVDLPPHAPPLVDQTLTADAENLERLLAEVRLQATAVGACGMTAADLDALFERAVKAHRAGETEVAQVLYEEVLGAQPDYAPALHLAAALSRERGDIEAAAALLERAVRAAPSFVDARIAAARLERDRGRVDNAVALVAEGLAQRPRHAAMWRVRGEIDLARNDPVAAHASFANALAIAPTDAEAHYNTGVAMQKQGNAHEAARAYQRALAFDPDLADAHHNLGVLFQEGGHVDAAVSAYRAVLSRDAGHVGAYKHLGEALLGAGRIDEWLASFRRFETNCPTALPLAVQALEACQFAADHAGIERYLDGLRRERFRARDAFELTDALEQLQYLLLFFDVEPEMLYRFAQTYTSTAPQVYGRPFTLRNARNPGKLRIGYLSADLRNHVMGKMMWQTVQHHDRNRFGLHFYSLSSVRDEWTERFAAIGETFAVLAGISEREAAQRIADDDVDVLVDLSGHTKGSKPGILALKPARVQITHVASAGGVGLDTVDFKLTDTFADVPSNQDWMIETLLPMQGCVYPYRRIEAATSHPFHRALLGIDSTTVVIGAFVTPMKLSRRCLTLWRDVLHRVPRARIAFSPTHRALRPVYERLMASVGIGPERLLFLPQGRDDSENQARYALVDFVLDPMPFGGVNGVLEPLDAGVPVVTLKGQRHGERSAYSILANLGVTQTVAEGGRDYVELAVRLADDAAFRREVRGAISAGLQASALVDLPAHARNAETAYIEALRRKAPEVLGDDAHG